MSQAKTPVSRPRTRRLNLRALVALGVVAVLSVTGLWALKAVQESRGKSSLFRQAEARLAAGEVPLALGYLNRYLELNPDDVEALDLKAKILADHARTEEQAIEAATAHNVVLGRAGNDPKRQETRRRLVKLDLRIAGRSRAAEILARDLIRRGADDAEAHRLLGRALVSLGVLEGKRPFFEEARREFEAAEAKEPGDVEGAERLAALYADRLGEPAKAAEVFDRVVAATGADPRRHASALLARSRYFAGHRDPARAQADLDQALKDAPADIEVRLASAQLAIERRDPASARVHLEAIDPSRRDDLRIKETEGLIDLAEQRPDDAIAAWRASLRQTGGNDADLTWRLAHVLLELGRVDQAEPLIAQYRRLSGGESPNPRARYLRGLSLLKRNRPAEAIAEVEPIRYKADKALEPHLQFLLGLAYESTRDTVRARDAYQAAANTGGDWGAPWLALTRLEGDARPLDAVALVEKGLTSAPNDPRLLASRAQYLWRDQVRKAPAERDWRETEQALAKAKRAAPGAPEVALAEADYLMSSGKGEEALSLLDAATRLNSRSPELWLARANALARTGSLARSLDTLDRAIAAAGPQSGFYLSKAAVLALKGQVSAAKAALVEGLARSPEEQRPLLWKTLGDFYQAQKDAPSARSAYEEWAKLQPENPDPKLALVELALATGDEAEIARAVEAVRTIGGPKSYFWRYARVEDLLRDRKGETPDPARDARRRSEARVLIDEIKTNDPQLPLGPLLEGRLFEVSGKTDQAIAAYEQALKRNGGALTVSRLVALLVREHRDADLDRLQKTLATMPVELERLAAVQALRLGNKGRAEQLAALAVQGDPRGIDTRVWQAEVLNALGKPKEAEAALRALIAQKPDDPTHWLQLLMLQIGQHDTPGVARTIDQIRAQVKTPYPELLLAQCYRAAGEMRKADAAYREALTRWPTEPDVLRSAVTFYDQTGRTEASEAALRALLRRDRRNGWATRKLAQLLATRPGNRASWEEALTLVGPEARLDDVPDDALARAAVYAEGPEPAHHARAVTILTDLVRELPNLSAAQDRLARLLLAAGDSRGAREHAARAVAVEQAAPDAILFYAGLLITLKDFEGAEVQLNRLAAVEPDGLPVTELRARILAAKGQGVQAADLLERAFSARPEGPEIMVIGEKMVRLLSGLNQPEAAERVARRLGTVSPRGACVLAELLSGRGKTDEALALVRDAGKGGDAEAAGTTALNLAVRPGADPRWLALADQLLGEAAKASSPPSIDLLQKQALALHFRRQHPQEIETYRAILSRNPSNFLFLNNLAWTLSEELNQPGDGLKWADEALKRVGATSAILDTRGVILTRLKRFDEAIADLTRASEARADGPILFHLARAYQKAGKGVESRSARDRAQAAGLARTQLAPSEQADWDAVMNP